MQPRRLAGSVLAVFWAAALLAACTSGGDAERPAGSDLSLVGAGYSFGMCGGPCVGELVIDGSQVTFSIHGHFDDQPLAENSGVLTAEALQKLRGFLDTLGDAELEDVYGCPDCADGGAAYVVLLRDGARSQHAYDFARPPEVLAELDGFASAVMSALEFCDESEFVVPDSACVPLQ